MLYNHCSVNNLYIFWIRWKEKKNMYISAGLSKTLSLSLSLSLCVCVCVSLSVSLSLSLSLSLRKTDLTEQDIDPMFIFLWNKTLKNSSALPNSLIWIELVLNHEMVRAVLTERQTSDCDVRCRITFSFQWKFHVFGPQYRMENQYDDFVKVMPR